MLVFNPLLFTPTSDSLFITKVISVALLVRYSYRRRGPSEVRLSCNRDASSMQIYICVCSLCAVVYEEEESRAVSPQKTKRLWLQTCRVHTGSVDDRPGSIPVVPGPTDRKTLKMILWPRRPKSPKMIGSSTKIQRPRTAGVAGSCVLGVGKAFFVEGVKPRHRAPCSPSFVDARLRQPRSRKPWLRGNLAGETSALDVASRREPPDASPSSSWSRPGGPSHFTSSVPPAYFFGDAPFASHRWPPVPWVDAATMGARRRDRGGDGLLEFDDDTRVSSIEVVVDASPPRQSGSPATDLPKPADGEAEQALAGRCKGGWRVFFLSSAAVSGEPAPRATARTGDVPTDSRVIPGSFD